VNRRQKHTLAVRMWTA